MNKDHIGVILQKDLQAKGIKISAADAAIIGKDLRKPMWSYHVLAGYVLIGLYLAKVIATSLQGIAFKSPLAKDNSLKDKFKSWLYIIFYLLFAASLFTGFMIVNGPKDLKEVMEFVQIPIYIW